MEKKRLLIIDTETLTPGMLKSQLEKMGVAVDILTDPHRALDHYKRGRYDMVVLDALPPLYKGFDICREIRKIKGSGSIPIIMTSPGGNHEDQADKASMAGATAFESKPFSLTSFAKRAVEFLNQNDSSEPPKSEPKPKEAASPTPEPPKPEAKPKAAPPPPPPPPPPPKAKPASSAPPPPPSPTPSKTQPGTGQEIAVKVNRALVTELKQALHKQGNAQPLITGDLFEVEVPHLLMKIFLYSQINLLPEFTILRFQCEKKKKEVYFRYGAPINVKSNLVSETLGRLLVEQGKIDRKQLEESILERKRTGVRQGDALIELGYITRAELEDALFYQERIKIADLFSWEEGTIEYFWSPKGLDKIQEFRLPMAQVILDGIGTGYSITRLRRKIERYEKEIVIPNLDPLFEWRNVGLETDQQDLVDRLGEKKTLKEWVNNSGLAEERILPLMYALLCTKRAFVASDPRAFELPIDGFDDCVLYGDEKPTGKKPSAAAQPSSEPAPEKAPTPAPEPKKAEASPQPKPAEEPKAAPVAEKPQPETPKIVIPTDRGELLKLLQDKAKLNHYEILGVDKSEQVAQIKKIYFKMAKEFHPDKFFKHDDEIKSAADDLMAKIGEAYNTLIDSTARENYNLYLETGKTQKEVNEEVNQIMKAEEDFRLGEVQIKKRNYDEAIELFEKAIKLNPNEREFDVHLGWAKYRKDPANLGLAKSLISKAIEGGVKSDQAHYYLSQIYQKEDNLKSAVEELKACIALNKFHPNAGQELRVLERQLVAAKESGGDKKGAKKKGLFRK